jgi:hypothetical protein
MAAPMRRTIATLSLVLLMFAPSTAAAGPWAPDAGHGYVKLWAKYFFGFGYAHSDGSFYDLLYQEASLSAYAEVGLFDRFALVLHAPIVQSFHLEDSRDGGWTSYVSPGDPTLSLRWQFLQQGRFAMGAEAGVRLPFARPGPVQATYARSEGHPRIGALEIGTGVWDFPLTISGGYGWDELYLAGSIGYVMRTSGFDHVVVWSVEGGTTIERVWGARGRVVGWHSIPVWFGQAAPRHESPSGIGNGTSYLGFQIELDYQFQENWVVGISIEGGLGYLVRQAGGPVLTVYVATRF